MPEKRKLTAIQLKQARHELNDVLHHPLKNHFDGACKASAAMNWIDDWGEKVMQILEQQDED